jgi:hypothetical protein
MTEYQEAIDQLYELHQKYNETHIIIIAGDINEDLNEPTSTKRNLYLRDFINECCLKYVYLIPVDLSCYPAIILLAVDFCIFIFEFAAHADWMVIRRIIWHIV